MDIPFKTSLDENTVFTKSMALTCARLTGEPYEFQSAVLFMLGYAIEANYWRTERVRMLKYAAEYEADIRSLSNKYADVTSYIEPNGPLSAIFSPPIVNKVPEPSPERVAEYNDQYKHFKSQRDQYYERAETYQLPISSLIESIEAAAHEWLCRNPVTQQEGAYYP